MSKQTNFSRKLALNSPDRKPSVFERLGTKSSVASGKNACRSWAQNGTCPLNKSCKLAHTHVLISPSKRSKGETMKKSVVVHKKSKDEHKKSGRTHQSSDIEWEGWELGDLEDADEKVLEKRKQELQRELQLQLKKEKELTRKKEKRSEKKRAASTSSSSTTTTESSTSTTSSSTSSSEPRKRQNRKRKRASSSSDSEINSQRRKKSPKTLKTKGPSTKRPAEKKDDRLLSEGKSKSVIVAKKSTVQKKCYSPGWEKSKVRSPVKQQTSKKSSPHHSPESKRKSSSPRYDKTVMRNKSKGYSPKQKVKESSPKRSARKVKESSVIGKEKSRQSPSKSRCSPSRLHKVSPGRSRRHEESSDKRRGHYEERKHSPRRDRSREKDRKREIRRGRSNDDDNGGLKKGGKILPLKPSSYAKDNGMKKEGHHKSEKNADVKSKEEENEKDRCRAERDKDRGEKEKSKCERDRSKHKKVNDEHDRRSARERDSEKSTARGRDDRCRDREAERLRFAKEREAERQKEREEALERCKERQRERERLEKERKEKEEKKHQRDAVDKAKGYERELPSLMDLKPENPTKNHLDSSGSKSSDKHLTRDGRRTLDRGPDKPGSQDKDGRDRGTPDKEHNRRDGRRSDENDRRLMDKDYENRRNREEVRNSSEVRRSAGDGRHAPEEGDSRRQWEDVRRVVDSIHDRRRSLDPSNSDRRQHPLVRRPMDDHYRRARGEGEMDARDFPLDERRGRKLLHGCADWESKDQKLDYRDPDVRDDWNHSDRHLDWTTRYDHKWMDREEGRDGGWNHYPRRPPHDEWAGDWPQDKPRPMFPEEERLTALNEEFSEVCGKRHNEPESIRPLETNKEKEAAGQTEEEGGSQVERSQKEEGDALSDISDDPDDILNQDDEAVVESPQVQTNTSLSSNQQIYVRSNEFLFDQRRPLLECLGERSLDFEEISDEELEEEARVSKGIVDVLGADWAGLVQETRPRPKRFESPGSAHRRWMMDRIISRLGVSERYAGKVFIDNLVEKYRHIKKEGYEESATPMDTCENGVKEEREEKEEAMEVKKEIDNENDGVEVKPLENVTDDREMNIFHSIPALHNAFMEERAMRSNLFLSHNRFKRALSARTDLNLRRELCNLPSKEPLHFTPPLDNKMYETSLQLLQNNVTMAAV